MPLYDSQGRQFKDGIVSHPQRPRLQAQPIGQCPACLGPAVHAPGEKTCQLVQLYGHDWQGNPKK